MYYTSVLRIYIQCILINLAKQGYCNHFVCYFAKSSIFAKYVGHRGFLQILSVRDVQATILVRSF